MFVTSLSAIMLSPLMIWLSIRVISIRHGQKISMGDQGNKKLARRIRAFGNFGEYTPMGLFLIGLVELQNGLAWPAALALVLGRYMHGFAYLEMHSGKPHFFWRGLGMRLTLLSLILAVLALIWILIQRTL